MLLSLSILQMVVSSSPKTAHDAWKIIEAYFIDKTTSMASSLKFELRSIKKGLMGMTDYMQNVKLIGDTLQAIGETESDHNLFMTILLGLVEDYRGFVSALNTHRTKPTFEQLRPLLLQEEIEIQHRANLTTSTIPTIDGEALMQTVDKVLMAVVGVDIAEAKDIMVDTIHTPIVDLM